MNNITKCEKSLKTDTNTEINKLTADFAKKHSQNSREIWVIALLITIILLMILTMLQIDRQWRKISSLEYIVNEQYQQLITNRENNQITQVPNSNINSTNINQSLNTQSEINVFSRAISAQSQADFAMGDINVHSFATQLATVSPLISADAYAAEVQGYVMESLLTRDTDTLKWVGVIAKSWRIAEDGLSVRFLLRDNVRFSDGVLLTADDVVFSFDFVMNESIAAPRIRAYFEKLKSVKKINQYEVEFEFREPYFEILSIAGGMEILPKHFYEGYLKTPNEFNNSKGLLMGSGPYRLENPKSWTPDVGQIELIRNQNYWGSTKPPFNKIIWKIIQNDSARLTTYRNGDIDEYAARPVEYQRLKSDSQIISKSHNFEYMPPVVGYSFIAWNQQLNAKPTKFADLRVRQAMSAITDVQRIIKNIYLNYAEPAVSPFSPTSAQHNPELVYQNIDKEKAKKLLADVGYKLGKNNVLQDEKGKSFEFKLTYFQANEDTTRLVLLLRDLYAEIGIKLIPDPQEWPVMLEKLNKSDFEAIILGWTSGIETNIYQMFHSSQIKINGDNFINYKNPKLDELIVNAQQTTDEAKRMQYWRAAEKIIIADQPYTFLMRRQSLVFIDKRFQNLKMSKLGLNYGFIPIETYVPKAVQKYTQ